MDAYPQIINASWIFPGQHLCIPVKPQDQDMKVMLIEFIGANGFALQEIDNYVQLEPLTIIKAEFSTEVSFVYFFRYSIGLNVLDTIQLLGMVSVENDRKAQFQWKVPAKTHDYIFVIACTVNYVLNLKR